ncbi:VENN motif pre-toxin domain-containing protein [Pseudomonas orientalis]|uniref:VENN motif pre-toxin domain-containing protein n=2 Tax=Pseudomonas orientalis TaxID=76758 RepID=UPI000F55FD7D|nr:Putative large exoprotein, ShlA/HecA/FhaA family [Pseudomonas orientalis]
MDAGKQVSLISGRDTALKGAQVSADKITATVGRDLTLQSLQDTDNYKSKQTDVSGGVSFAIIGTGGSANLSISKSKIGSKYQSVQEQTGLFGGKGGYQIDVGNHTQLDGSVIGSTATADKNHLSTGTLGWSVLKNKADYTSQLQSASVSSGSDGTNAFISNMPTGSLIGFNHGDSDSGTTSSAISNGSLDIRDPAKQQQDVATLSHDVEHANGAISPIFDKEKEQKRLRQVQLIADIGTQAADITRTQGAINAANAQKDPEAVAAARDKLIREGNTQPTDKEIAAQVTRTVMEPYGTGGDYQRAAQAVTAALQGLAGGDIGSALAGASAPYLANLIKQSAQGNDTARIMAHVVLGAVVAQAQGNSAVAGAAGAGTGELIAAQLYPGIKPENLSEKQKQTVSALSTLASGLAGGLAGGDLSGALAGAKAGNNAVENNSVADIASALAEGKTLEQKAEERINAENEHYKEQNCAGLSAEACSAQMYAERRESLAYTLAGGAVVVGTVAGGMLLGPALLNACGMNPVACTELTIAAVEVPFGAAMAGGGALGVGGFGSLAAKEIAATADATSAARTAESATEAILKDRIKKPLTDDNAFAVIDVFRDHKQGMDKLGDYIPVRGDNFGTVAVVEVNGQKVFGVNSSALVNDADKNLARQWRDKMGFNQGEGQVVFHAEAYSLMRAYEKTGGNLPAQMTLYVDRQTCGTCKQYLPELMHEMKIDTVNVVMKNGQRVTIDSRAR